MYCIVLYFVLYCILLYHIILYCIVLYFTVLWCIVLYCIVLYCITLFRTVLYCIALLGKPHLGSLSEKKKLTHASNVLQEVQADQRNEDNCDVHTANAKGDLRGSWNFVQEGVDRWRKGEVSEVLRAHSRVAQGLC